MGDSESEFEISGKVALPELAGFAAKLDVAFRRTWSNRGQELVTTAAELAHVQPDDLALAAASDDRVGDLLWRSLDRARTQSDPEYRDALARLVAAALDDARVLEVDHVASQLLKLEPVQFRALLRCAFVWERLERTRGETLVQPVDDPRDATSFTPHTSISITDCATKLSISDELAEGLLSTLAGLGYLRATQSQGSSGNPLPTYVVTGFATQSVQLLYGIRV